MFHKNDKVPISFNGADSIRRLLNYLSSKETKCYYTYLLNELLNLIIFNRIYFKYK